MLPADNTEMERLGNILNAFACLAEIDISILLDYLHDLVYIQRGRNYTGPVREVLAHIPGQDKAVLDLGCEILDLVELRNDRRLMPILGAVPENGVH